MSQHHTLSPDPFALAELSSTLLSDSDPAPHLGYWWLSASVMLVTLDPFKASQYDFDMLHALVYDSMDVQSVLHIHHDCEVVAL